MPASTASAAATPSVAVAAEDCDGIAQRITNAGGSAHGITSTTPRRHQGPPALLPAFGSPAQAGILAA